MDIGYGRPVIGHIRAADIKEVTLVNHSSAYRVSSNPSMGKESYLTCGNIEVDRHSAKVVSLHCPHDIGSIVLEGVSIKDSYYLEPSIFIHGSVKASRIGLIRGDLPHPVNKSIIDYGAQSGYIGSIYSNNFTANKTSNSAAVHFRSSKYSTIGSMTVTASSISSTAAGVKYTGCYNISNLNAKIENMNIGVKDGGGNGRLGATMCVSLGNTTATDLPTSVLVANVGNYQWTI